MRATGVALAKITSKVVHKHYRLDEVKIDRAQELMGTKNETETIERALEEAIMNREKNIRLWAAADKFLKSGAEIEDVFGHLE